MQVSDYSQNPRFLKFAFVSRALCMFWFIHKDHNFWILRLTAQEAPDLQHVSIAKFKRHHCRIQVLAHDRLMRLPISHGCWR